MLHLVLVLVVGGSEPLSHSARLRHLPRIEKRADVRLWRDASDSRVVFGHATRPLFVRASDAAALATLEALGTTVEPGRWTLVHLDAVALGAALGGDGALELRAAPAHRPMLDRSVPEIGAHIVHAGTGATVRRTGAGVLVGIIDTGVDLSHPAFRRADGSSRVIAVWDQDGAGRAPVGFDYGHACSRRDILTESCDLGDPVGHGTHVAGIAAGNNGIAPEADIAVVRSDTFTRLADAVSFLVQLAWDRRQPLVINLSVGGHYGPHDGRTPLEQYLGEVADRGRLMVAAAGNYGQDRMHLGLDVAPEASRVLLEGLPWGTPAEAIVELWSAPADDVALTLELWDGAQPVASLPLYAHASELLDGALEQGGRTVLEVSYGVELSDSGLACRTLVLDTSFGPLPAGHRLVLAIAGRGRVDAWISQSDYRSGAARFGGASEPGFVAGDGELSVTVPATAADVIAVGSYTVRSAWLSEGQTQQSMTPALAFGALSPFSSRGPTTAPYLTGAKPDLAAPGSVIVSARATDVPPGASTLDAEQMVMQGTSMAAPHVTGTLALVLEAKGDIDPAMARRILHDSARGDRDTGVVPNGSWGFGKLDAQAAVRLAEMERDGCAAAPALWPLLLLPLALRRRR